LFERMEKTWSVYLIPNGTDTWIDPIPDHENVLTD